MVASTTTRKLITLISNQQEVFYYILFPWLAHFDTVLWKRPVLTYLWSQVCSISKRRRWRELPCNKISNWNCSKQSSPWKVYSWKLWKPLTREDIRRMFYRKKLFNGFFSIFKTPFRDLTFETMALGFRWVCETSYVSLFSR